MLLLVFLCFFFFFQAEDGIRDGRVTGVQTCALPILNVHHRQREVTYVGSSHHRGFSGWAFCSLSTGAQGQEGAALRCQRSEERRVGKECRSRWWPDH